MLLPLVLQVQITLKSKTQQRPLRHYNLWHSVCRAVHLVILLLFAFELERGDGEVSILARARLRAQLSLPRSDGT